MRNFLTLIANVCCILMLALGTGCNRDGTGGPSASVTLRFAARVDGQPLHLGAQRYTDPTGSGEFTVEDFKMYISNVMLRNLETGNAHVEKDSYHLVRFVGEASNALEACFDADADRYIDECFRLSERRDRLYDIRNVISHGEVDAENPEELIRIETRLRTLWLTIWGMFGRLVPFPAPVEHQV